MMIVEPSVLIDIIVKIYPDIRRLINILQKFSSENNGVIDSSVLAFESADDELIKLILEKNWTGARKYCRDKNIGNELYTFLYSDLLPKLEADKEKFAQVLLIIAEYQFKSQTVTDIEIPMAACLMSIIGNI